MIIESIFIGHFGHLSDMTLELGEGLNVILGPNESGKTTVAAFIRYMLYGFGAYRAKDDLLEREKRISRDTQTAEGTMTVRLSDGRRYRLERKTTAVPQDGRVGYREESALVDLADGGTRLHILPGETFFSVPEQVYVNTAYFAEFSDSHVNEGETTQAMENILFSGDERVSSMRALKSLREARDSLSHPSGVGGAIYEMGTKSDGARLRLGQATRRAAQIHKAEAELHALRGKIKNAETRRDELAELDEFYRGYLTICDFDKLHEVEDRHRALTEERDTLRRVNGHDGFLPDEAYVATLGAAERVVEVSRQNYLRTVEKVDALRRGATATPEQQILLDKIREADGAKAVEKEYTRLYKRGMRFRVLSWLFVALAALGLGALLFFTRPLAMSPLFAMGLVAVLAALLLSGAFFSNRRRTTRAVSDLCARFDAASGADLLCRLRSAEGLRREMEEKREIVRVADENAEISRQNYERLRRELETLAAKWGKTLSEDEGAENVATISRLALEYVTEDRRLSEEIAEVRGRMTELRAKLAGLSEVSIRSQVPPARRAAMEKTNYRTIQEGLTYYRGTCETFYDQQIQLLQELDGYRRDAENPALLRSEVSVYTDRIVEMRARHRAYELACDVLALAGSSLRAEISPRLSGYAGQLLSKVTDGRYGALDITNRLAMAYREGEAMYPIPMMSGAAREIAYIALRLALIDMLYEEVPPLCFDGSFAHQDDERTTSLLRFLSSKEAGVQCILLTCHERDATFAAEVSEKTKCFTMEGAGK